MPTKYRLVIAADDAAVRESLQAALADSAFRVRVLADSAKAKAFLAQEVPDSLILQTTRFPGVIREIHACWPRLPLIAVTPSDLGSAVAAFDEGAFDCLTMPFEASDVRKLAASACEHGRRQAESVLVCPTNPGGDISSEIIGRSPAMREIFRAVARLARRDVPVIIEGEVGTGKELIARALHRHSRRATRPLVVARLAGLTASEIDRGLFGDRSDPRGESQERDRPLVQTAEQGTLLLDQAMALSPATRDRLIRFVVEGADATATGGGPRIRLIATLTRKHSSVSTDVASHSDLAEHLGAITLTIPPLRERPEDIPLLLEHLLSESAREFGLSPRRLTEEALQALCGLDWPGNVAQLATVCRRVTAMSPTSEIGLKDLPKDLWPEPECSPATNLLDDWRLSLSHWADDRLKRGEVGLAKLAFDSVENVLIAAAMRHTGGHRQNAARLLGVGRNTLTRKIGKNAFGAGRSHSSREKPGR